MQGHPTRLSTCAPLASLPPRPPAVVGTARCQRQRPRGARGHLRDLRCPSIRPGASGLTSLSLGVEFQVSASARRWLHCAPVAGPAPRAPPCTVSSVEGPTALWRVAGGFHLLRPGRGASSPPEASAIPVSGPPVSLWPVLVRPVSSPLGRLSLRPGPGAGHDLAQHPRGLSHRHARSLGPAQATSGRSDTFDCSPAGACDLWAISASPFVTCLSVARDWGVTVRLYSGSPSHVRRVCWQWCLPLGGLLPSHTSHHG